MDKQEIHNISIRPLHRWTNYMTTPVAKIIYAPERSEIRDIILDWVLASFTLIGVITVVFLLAVILVGVFG